MKHRAKYKDLQNEYESLEKQLLALFYSGVYISSNDLIEISKKLNYNLPLKERNVLLQKLMGDAKKDNKLIEFLGYLRDLLKVRGVSYVKLGEKYPYAQKIIGSWLQKAKSTDRLVKIKIGQLKLENL